MCEAEAGKVRGRGLMVVVLLWGGVVVGCCCCGFGFVG